MKKLQNEKATLVDQALAGYALAHRDILRLVEGTHMMERRQPKENGKVRFLMGNGAGHEPAVIGWVGKGMFDMNVVGDVFTAPNGYAIFEGIKRLSEGGPVLLAVQNHAGDVMNAGMAMEMAEEAGINARSVLFYDDIASAPKGMEEERRGMAGMLFYTKIVGAMAERGAGMDELIAMFERVRDRTRTISVALTNCTHPVSGLSMFDGLADQEIEVGMGVHGEGGMGRMVLPTSRDLAKLLCEKLIEDGGYREGDKMLVLVNGAGGMTMMEMATFYADVHAYLASRGMTVTDCRVGNYLTTQELSGVSLSFAKVDDEMISLWYDPCQVSQF
jgi:dihydroxyacetone kinase-like protein